MDGHAPGIRAEGLGAAPEERGGDAKTVIVEAAAGPRARLGGAGGRERAEDDVVRNRPEEERRQRRGAVAPGRMRARHGARMRDVRTGVVRPARPGDVAVLCRTNEGCAALAPELSRKKRRAIAGWLIDRYGLGGTLEVSALVGAGAALEDGIDRRLPGAVRLGERPIFHRTAAGTIVRGFADLVIEMDQESHDRMV
jgi:hypothetical protein